MFVGGLSQSVNQSCSRPKGDFSIFEAPPGSALEIYDLLRYCAVALPKALTTYNLHSASKMYKNYTYKPQWRFARLWLGVAFAVQPHDVCQKEVIR